MKKLFTCLGSSAISRFVYLNDRGPEGAAMNRPPVGPEASKDKPEQKGMGLIDIGKRALEKVVAGAKALDASEKGKARMVTDAEAHIQELDMQIDEEQRELEDVQLRGGDVTAQQNIVDDLIRQKMAAEKGLRKVIDKAYGPAKAGRDVPGPNQGLPPQEKGKEKVQLTPDQKYDRMKQIFDKGKMGGVTLASLKQFLIKKSFLQESDSKDKGKFVTAVINLQKYVGVEPDGVFGPATLKKIDGSKQEYMKDAVALIRGISDGQREVVREAADPSRVFVVRNNNIPGTKAGDIVYILKRPKGETEGTEEIFNPANILQMAKAGPDGKPAAGEMVLKVGNGKKPGEIIVMGNDERMYTIKQDLTSAPDEAYVDSARGQFRRVLEKAKERSPEDKATILLVDLSSKGRFGNYQLDSVSRTKTGIDMSDLRPFKVGEDKGSLEELTKVVQKGYLDPKYRRESRGE